MFVAWFNSNSSGFIFNNEEWLFKKFKKQEIIKQVRAEFWGAVRYHYEDQSEDQALLGLLANDVNTHGSVVISFSPLKEKTKVVLKTYSRIPNPDLVKQAELIEMLESPGATLYVYKMIDVEEREHAGIDA